MPNSARSGYLRHLMITYVIGNLFESPAQTLVNTVNTTGAMGKGVALQFKRFYPDMFREYQQLCERGEIAIGRLFLYRTPHKLILNFPTKDDWRKPSRLEYIEMGLKTFVDTYEQAGIYSVAFPPLGCGNGELRYAEVRPLMERYLGSLPIPIFLYPPHPSHAVPEHRNERAIKAWLHQQPRDLPFNEVWRDLREALASRRSFATLVKGTPFEAEFVDTPEGEYVRVRASGKISAYQKTDLQQLWRDLRAHGLATSRSIDSRHSAFLFPVLSVLPYVRAVELADSFDKVEYNRAWGLQLIPVPDRERQEELALQN